MLYWHDSLYFDTVDHTCTISVARDSAPVISNNLKTYHNSDFVTNSYGESWDSSCEKSWVPVRCRNNNSKSQGRIQDFFLGGGALISCSTSTPINHIVFFFLQNTSCIRKPQVISKGGGRARPLHPPPRFAPESLFKKSTIPKLKMLGPLCKQTVTEDRLQNSVKIYSFYFKAQQR